MPSQEKTGDILARFPGPVTLRPSRLKWILVLLGALVFVAGGIGMIVSGETMGWVVAGFFGLCIPVGVIALLPGASGMTLHRDGFDISNMFRRQSYPWRDVSGFDAVRIPPAMTKIVVFDHAGAAGKTIAKLNVGLVGRNAGLPDTYGIPADVLAGLMAAWRERALAAR